MILLASQVMDSAAALLNDTAKTIFTYDAQRPYLNMALTELREYLELNNIPLTNDSDATITVPAGSTVVAFNAVSPEPALPSDLVEPLELYERTAGSDDDFLPMSRRQFLPPYVTITSNLIYWAWMGQEIKFIGANTDIEIRIDYTKSVLPNIQDQDDAIDYINAASFLYNRTGALCAQFIGENSERADVLNVTAQLAIDRAIGIGVKGGQSIATRRRPFNQAFKTWNNSN